MIKINELTADEFFLYEERAAKIEHEGKLTREIAERLALEEIEKRRPPNPQRGDKEGD